MHPPPSRRRPGALKRPWQRLQQWLGESPAARALEGELPRVFPLFLLLFGVGMILISLVGDQGLIAYYQLQREAESLRHEVATLQQRRGDLVQRIEALRESPAYIELLARQRLGLVRPGETVIQLRPGDSRP